MGRTHPELLIALFPTWALTLALLTRRGRRAAAARAPARGPASAPRSCSVAMALTVCSLAQFPPPWTQLQRIGQDTPSAPLIEGEAPLPVYARAFLPDPSTRAFFAPRPGAKVAILLTTGHEIARRVRRRERLALHRPLLDAEPRAAAHRRRRPARRRRQHAVPAGSLAARSTTTLRGWGFRRAPDEVEWGATTGLEVGRLRAGARRRRRLDCPDDADRRDHRRRRRARLLLRVLPAEDRGGRAQPLRGARGAARARAGVRLGHVGRGRLDAREDDRDRHATSARRTGSRRWRTSPASARPSTTCAARSTRCATPASTTC